MAKIAYTDYGQATSSAFMGDFTDREHIVLGQLVATGWTGLVDGVVPAGTLLGRTNTEKEAGAKFGAAADGDDEIFILADDTDIDRETGCNLVRHGSLIKYDLLPSFAGATVAVKGKLHTMYTLIKA